MTQGLLSIAQNQPIYEPRTKRLLQRRGLVRGDGVATETGRALAAKTLLNERRWAYWRSTMGQTETVEEPTIFSLVNIEDRLTQDQINSIDRGLAAAQKEKL